ncbi:glycoside hydrolase family 2 protein [Karstenula rhodostoma CBS 690.94]|uniref:Glycoside hydrolase family 2 protein n=1 Tax=Karstenula rhodostoma CBS 690.94 TaxID=1392251 RepID=A0A9P4UFV9_9PLEO|nr:glycoside hydrolase family 2 protein [Karstenula rhodostoma CBS 690.94]
MRRLFLSSFFSLASLLTSTADASPLVSAPGQAAVIPSWRVGSSIYVGNDAAKLSVPGLDVSGWYAIRSKGTLMATLLENKVYNDDSIFFSMRLDQFEQAPFQVPWFYRAEFEVSPGYASAQDYLQLKTHGISSRADIYLNGALVADKSVQVGAYAGLTFDIASEAKPGKNVLLIRVYPTDYNRDFALGFVDWNPYPPDNGTGVWRDVEVKQTGKIAFAGTPRLRTQLDGTVQMKADVRNWGNESTLADVYCKIFNPKNRELTLNGLVNTTSVALAARSTQEISLRFKIDSPLIWWPAQWGEQPLYNFSCTLSTGDVLSDSTPKVRFGIRTVTSTLNKFNDTMFFVNGRPFQVIGAGYTSDIFLRFEETKLYSQFLYVLDVGLNTVRLEGKQEHPRLYELADEMGIMIMAGWECCDKWEGWSYNDEGSGEKWKDADYAIANASMRHEAEMMQHHPSLLAFLVGSDFWPDDHAVRIYVDALRAFDWDVPIIASASQRGYPDLLGNGGMKMDGPYDWVPPNYWYTDQMGAAFGFGSELGAGVGTPELRSLKRFLNSSERDDLWKHPTKGLYHMSTNVSSFFTREIYNDALWTRYGAPTSLENYLLKAQLMDYEATRAEFEAYAAKWTAERPATGMIYWMLNNAWPSLHWNLFDYYLHPAGSYFGTKVGTRLQHVAYDYLTRSVYLINRSQFSLGPCAVDVELLDLNGTTISNMTITTQVSPNNSTQLFGISGINQIRNVALLKLVLKGNNTVISRNVYHLTREPDTLDFGNSTWYHTPVTKYADFRALNALPRVDLSVKALITRIRSSEITAKVTLQNRSELPAVFVRLNLVDFLDTWDTGKGYTDITPVTWSDNYVTLWPEETLELEVNFRHGDVRRGQAVRIEIEGWNVRKQTAGVSIAGGKHE